MNCLKEKKEELRIYNKVEKIYIPLDYINSSIKKDSYVLKGSKLGKLKDSDLQIFSSVSGKVIGYEQKNTLNVKNINCIVIENDYKEKVETGINNLVKLNKYDFFDFLKKYSIVELDSICLPLYLKYDKTKINTLIIDSTVNSFIIKNYCEQILETIDMIIETNNINKAIIILNKKDKSIIKTINNYIGTYLNIKVEFISKEKGYKTKNGTIVNNVSTIYAIYQALKLNKPMIEKYINISYNDISYNLLIKLGTPLKDIIDELNIKSTLININNIMLKDINDLIITPDINNIEIK